MVEIDSCRELEKDDSKYSCGQTEKEQQREIYFGELEKNEMLSNL